MTLQKRYNPGDRVVWNGGPRDIWHGTIVQVLNAHELVVQWDDGRETLAPAWSRRLRIEESIWDETTLTDPVGW